MGESVDVKSLRNKFNNQARDLDSLSSKSFPSRPPWPGVARPTAPTPPRPQSPVVPPPLPRQNLDPMAFNPSKPALLPRQVSDSSKIKHTTEMLQSMMLRHPGMAKPKPPAPPPEAASTPLAPRQPFRERGGGDVIPLRRPLSVEGPQPLKPKRPPNVNLEPFLRHVRGTPTPLSPKRSDKASPSPLPRQLPLMGALTPPKHPLRSTKPTLQRVSPSVEDMADTYDDIGSFNKNESHSDAGSQRADQDGDDVYQLMDEEPEVATRADAGNKNNKEAQMKSKQDAKARAGLRKRDDELRKRFQLRGPPEVLHTARVRHNWNGGGKLDLRVGQGERVDILRVTNNPGGKWLARSQSGNYGYISNTCVDIDYEEVKRKLGQSGKQDPLALPPPPPDPPGPFNTRVDDSTPEDDDDYDDIQTMLEDFPPPPPPPPLPPPLEVNLNPKLEKELRKKFKCEGPLRILHTMMVDPNSIIKKPGGKDLPVTQGDVLDIIEFTSSKKALCRNRTNGKCGYVARHLLLPLEGDIYDDVDYSGDGYDNYSWGPGQ